MNAGERILQESHGSHGLVTPWWQRCDDTFGRFIVLNLRKFSEQRTVESLGKIPWLC